MVCAFLPQTGLLLPFAAFFVPALLWLLFGKNSRGYGVCLLLGALAGLLLTAHTRQKLDRVHTAYADREVTLTAEVEEVSASYYPGVVHAVLRVEPTGGEKTAFRVECVCMPKCTAGERVQARFALEVPARTQQLSSYADGIALSGEYLSGMKHLGPSESFRAKTARLQKRLSAALRKGMAQGPAGVLAAMVLGDRTHLSKDLRSAYRAAGLSHVLVVSGMHVSILCGSVFAKYLPEKKKRERGYASRRRQALFGAAMALLLAGVTGLTPSVLRAATAVWVSALGVWVYGPPDALTSLGVAGVWMTLGNSYAVCDIGFELSFAAVLGTLAGAELARKGRRFPLLRNGVWETLCVSACASAATFPVLVLRGLSASLYALVSSVAVLWLVEPVLRLGLATALLGCWPALAPLHRACSLCAATLAGCLNRWALWVSGWPGAQIYFDTACAALICLCRSHLPAAVGAGVAGVPLACPAAGGTALSGADGGAGHRFGERPEPGDRPGGAGREPERSGRGHHAGRERRGALPGRQQYPAGGGNAAHPAGRAGSGNAGRPADEPANALHAGSQRADGSRRDAPLYYPPCPQQPGRAGSAASTEWLHRPHHGGGAAVCCPERERPVGKACPG